jgi:hypothetical protein
LINLSPELVTKLRLRPGLNYSVLANQKRTPGGMLSAVSLRDARGFYAIAEKIQDNIELLTPAERQGIKVEQLPARDRTLVYEDSCKIVYNVPTSFTIMDRQIVLHAYETRAAQIGDANYTISLNASQFVVPKDCPRHLEGGRSQVEYTIVRNQ